MLVYCLHYTKLVAQRKAVQRQKRAAEEAAKSGSLPPQKKKKKEKEPSKRKSQRVGTGRPVRNRKSGKSDV